LVLVSHIIDDTAVLQVSLSYMAFICMTLQNSSLYSFVEYLFLVT